MVGGANEPVWIAQGALVESVLWQQKQWAAKNEATLRSLNHGDGDGGVKGRDERPGKTPGALDTARPRQRRSAPIYVLTEPAKS
jgi:hypothetical protein